MAWILESTLQALSRVECERSLTLKERVILHLRKGAPFLLPVEVLEHAKEQAPRQEQHL